MEFIKTYFCCCFGRDKANHPRWLAKNVETQNEKHGQFFKEKKYGLLSNSDDEEDDFNEGEDPLKTADRIIHIITTASTQAEVDRRMSKIRAGVSAVGLRDKMAENIIERLVEMLKRAEDLGSAAQPVVLKAREVSSDVFGWAEDHPELATCLAFAAAVAALWILMPWVLEAIGFGAEGPMADSIAAQLQVRYMGLVPKGSWFSFFQRVAMTSAE